MLQLWKGLHGQNLVIGLFTPVFAEILPFSLILYVPIPLTAVRDDASVLLWSSQEVSLDRPAERQAAHINGPGVHMHRWTTAREHSQHFDDITPPLCCRPPSLCLLLKQARSLTSKKKAGISERTRAGSGRGGAARKRMKREGELGGGGWLTVLVGLDRTHTQAHTQEDKRTRNIATCCDDFCSVYWI